MMQSSDLKWKMFEVNDLRSSDKFSGHECVKRRRAMTESIPLLKEKGSRGGRTGNIN